MNSFKIILLFLMSMRIETTSHRFIPLGQSNICNGIHWDLKCFKKKI